MWFSVMTRSLELGTVVRDFTGWVADSSAIQFCSKGLVKLHAPLDSELFWVSQSHLN
jgi:hypothetical protein